jgi:hypothetical protein
MTLQENYKHSTLNIELFELRTIATPSTNPTVTTNATLQHVDEQDACLNHCGQKHLNKSCTITITDYIMVN